ncbi:DUF5947 family protein, partial [Pseudonocardia pini]|uniref:DUF5947 family protein n=1 Tax=Pseudonocardia pini TaxID=2758030 RepID=UPI0028B073E3
MTGLRRYLTAPDPVGEVVERCELCATPVPARHPHLVQVAQRRLLCACGPCGFLFDQPGAGGGEYARVPDRYLADPGFRLAEADWDALQIPVGTAFFLHNSVRGCVVACYPSPAGATESELSLDAWASGPGVAPLARELRPDVEALLVRRDPPACLLVPVDACYRLVGLVRLHWRGFDGGAEAHAAVDAFFADLRERAR